MVVGDVDRVGLRLNNGCERAFCYSYRKCTRGQRENGWPFAGALSRYSDMLCQRARYGLATHKFPGEPEWCGREGRFGLNRLCLSWCGLLRKKGWANGP